MFIPVIVVDKINTSPALFTCMNMMGGACLMGFSGSSSMFSEWKKNLPEVCFQKRVTKKSQYVFIVSSLCEVLTEAEQHNVVLHEIGHSVLKHFETMQVAGILNNETLEIEADTYAVSISKNPQALKTALIKMIEWKYQNRINELNQTILEVGHVFSPEELVDLRTSSLENSSTVRNQEYGAMASRFVNLDKLIATQS